MMKFRFKGKLEYVPFNEKEWYFQKRDFDTTITSKDFKSAQLKIQSILLLYLKIQAKRINISYEWKDVTNEKEKQ